MRRDELAAALCRPAIERAAMIRVGTAGWNVPRAVADRFPATGSHLERYAATMCGAEIDTSFYRPHRHATYVRWAAATPPAFRFSAKMPQSVTHEARLHDAGPAIERFIGEVGGLGDRLGALLVQLPPSLALDAAVADAFFRTVRALHPGALVCEPRHRSWFGPEGDDLLTRHRVARAAVDPAAPEGAAVPGGCTDHLVYYRWHGSPRMYRSAYGADWLAARVGALLEWPSDRDVWCVFDNTAAGAALADALRMATLLRERTGQRGRA